MSANKRTVHEMRGQLLGHRGKSQSPIKALMTKIPIRHHSADEVVCEVGLLLGARVARHSPINPGGEVGGDLGASGRRQIWVGKVLVLLLWRTLLRLARASGRRLRQLRLERRWVGDESGLGGFMGFRD